MNSKVVGLGSQRGPLLQVALDITDMRDALRVCRALPLRRVILEVGTPLLKAHGISAIRAVKKESQGRMVIADTKTLDAAEVEVSLAKKGGADGATVSALAPRETVEIFGATCKAKGLLCLVDLLGSSIDARGLATLAKVADVVICHGGIDQGLDPETLGLKVLQLKNSFPGKLVAVAGGITPRTTEVLVRSGADIVIVGRHITGSRDPGASALEMLRLLRGQEPL